MRFCTRRIARIPCLNSSSFIKTGRLTFGRWIKQAPYSPHCGVVARIPQTTQIAQLPLGGAVFGCGVFSRHDGSSQRCRLPGR